jgi:hypothetical protein
MKQGWEIIKLIITQLSPIAMTMAFLIVLYSILQ